MTSPLCPQTGGARVRPKVEICRVKKSCKPIRLTLMSLPKSTQKGMTSLMVTVRVRG
jgi:hypothetical protein